jgi:hypothetical protein
VFVFVCACAMRVEAMRLRDRLQGIATYTHTHTQTHKHTHTHTQPLTSILSVAGGKGASALQQVRRKWGRHLSNVQTAVSQGNKSHTSAAGRSGAGQSPDRNRNDEDKHKRIRRKNREGERRTDVGCSMLLNGEMGALPAEGA